MCKKHPEAVMAEACGEAGCGMCYAEAMMAEPYRPYKGVGELVYGYRGGHRNLVFLGVRKNGVFIPSGDASVELAEA